MRFLLLALGAVSLLALGAVGFAIFGPDDDRVESAEPSEPGSGTDAGAESAAGAGTGDGPVQEIRLLLQGIGYEGIDVEERDGTIFVSGTVDSSAELAAVVTASASLADGLPIDTEQLTVGAGGPAGPETVAEGSSEQSEPLQRLQVLLNRTVAATPIIFEPGTSTIARWQTDTLDQVADILLDNPGIAVSVVGYTDNSGPAEDNQTLSGERASAVRDYLIEAGIAPGLIQTDARGESEATGIRDISYLERRVEFEVVAASRTPPVPLPLDVGVIVPSPRDDLAFSQSLVDALDVLNGERGGLTMNVSDNMFDVEEAGEQAQRYAQSGSDVVILHGAQYLPLIEPLAEAWPDVVFASGPNPLETDLPNVFVYTIAAEQGAYVLGDLAASLTSSGTIGIVGPIPAPEPQLFVEGFRLGAEERGAQVISEYVGSFSDAEAAAAVAQDHVAAGADVLTGTSQLTIGPIDVAKSEGMLWFANQANQTVLAPENVVASQVYHFEVAIREILAEIDSNSTTGGTFPLTLANGGMLLEFNPNYSLDEQLRRRADDLLFEVTAGSITIDVDVGE